MDNKAMRKQIKAYVDSKPNHDIGTYTHVKTVGTKWVTLIDLVYSEIEKISLEKFYIEYVHESFKSTKNEKSDYTVNYINEDGEKVECLNRLTLNEAEKQKSWLESTDQEGTKFFIL